MTRPTSAAAPLYACFDGPQQAPPLLLGGPLGTSTAIWQPILHGLAQRWRVVRYDHRGHGRSPSPLEPWSIRDIGRDVLELMDRHSLDRVSLCGASFGGMIAQWLAVHAPERVERLILICTSAAPGSRVAWLERAALARSGGLAPSATAIVSRWTTPGFAACAPPVIRAMVEMLCANDPDGYAACCEAISNFDISDLLVRITAHTMVIGADADTGIPVEHSEQLSRAIPGAQFHLVRGAAHIPWLERPAEVLRVILDQIDSDRTDVGSGCANVPTVAGRPTTNIRS